MLIWITYNSATDYIEQGFTAQEAALIIPDKTITAIQDALHNLGHQSKRIGNVFKLIKHLEAGERCDLVFNLADGSIGTGREALIPALLDAYKIPYTFSDPVTLAICTNKAITKQLVQHAGIKTAQFSIVNKLEDIATINMQYPVFLKPIMAGRSLGVDSDALVLNHADLEPRCLNLLKKYKQPVLVEEYLPGREFTVGIVGQDLNTASLGVIEIKSTANVEKFYYDRLNKVNSDKLVDRSLATDSIAIKAQSIAIDVWKILGCRGIGRVDIRCDQHREPNFVEVNTIPGLHPEDSDLVVLAKLNNLSYTDLIKGIINNFA